MFVCLPLLFQAVPGKQWKNAQRALDLCLQSLALRWREAGREQAVAAIGKDCNLQRKPLGTFPGYRTRKDGRGDQNDRHDRTAADPDERRQSRTFRTTGSAGLRDHCDMDPAYILACLSPNSS